LRQGFTQDPAFDKLSLSNSYESKEEVKEEKHSCSHDNCGCASEDKSTEVGKVDDKSTDVVDIDNETKLVTIKSYSTPSDLVVVGCHLGDTVIGNDSDFSITDDFSSFRVKIGSKMLKGSFETDGFANIITLTDFIKVKDELIANDTLEWSECFIIPQFKGDIKVGGIDKNDKYLDIDINDYILHQSEKIVDVVMVLPEGNEIVKITEDNIDSVITQYTRDSKITTILDSNDKKDETK
jgi:hypothetical protein